MWLGTLRHENVLWCVAHVQHDYLSSFNQSDHCFLSLSLLKLPGFLGTVTATVNTCAMTLRSLSTQRFLATDGNRKWAGEAIVLACEMFTSCFHARLKHVAYLRSLFYVPREKLSRGTQFCTFPWHTPQDQNVKTTAKLRIVNILYSMAT